MDRFQRIYVEIKRVQTLWIYMQEDNPNLIFNMFFHSRKSSAQFQWIVVKELVEGAVQPTI